MVAGGAAAKGLCAARPSRPHLLPPPTMSSKPHLNTKAKKKMTVEDVHRAAEGVDWRRRFGDGILGGDMGVHEDSLDNLVKGGVEHFSHQLTKLFDVIPTELSDANANTSQTGNITRNLWAASSL